MALRISDRIRTAVRSSGVPRNGTGFVFTLVQAQADNQHVEKHTLQCLDDMRPELGFGETLAEQVLQKLADDITKNKQQDQQYELTNGVFSITDMEKLKTPER